MRYQKMPLRTMWLHEEPQLESTPGKDEQATTTSRYSSGTGTEIGSGSGGMC